jgi:hypothetical protein
MTTENDQDEDERDMRKIVLYDDEALKLMQGWTRGQSDPLYAISSTGGWNYAWVFSDAIANINRDLSRVKKLGRNKFQLGQGTFTKAEIDELRYIRDALQMTLDNPESVTVDEAQPQLNDKRALIGPGTDGLYRYHGASIEVSSAGLRNWFATVRFRSQEKDFDARSSDDVLEKAMEWIDAAPEHKRDFYGKPIFNEKRGVVSAPHHVADFNTLDDLIAHARDELGATHVLVDDANTKLYFPRDDSRNSRPYEEASVWQKDGYWHAQGPGARTRVAQLPEEVQPIGGGRAERRAAESSGSTGHLTPRQIQDFRNGFVEGYREGRHGETEVDGRPASPEDAEGIRLGLLAGARYRQGDSSAKTIDDAVTAWIEANGGEDDHPGHRSRAAEAPRIDARAITRALAARVGDDGTGDLRVIVDSAIRNGDSLAIDDLAAVVQAARADAKLELSAAEVARKQDPTGGYGEANVKRWMRSHVAEYVDPLTGEVNTTKLAEEAAYEANQSEWLDDSTHPIWDWAIEEAERYERAHHGAPGRHAVRDYIAVDRRGRTTAGPFKTYGDAKSAAGPADVVQFVRPGVEEARRTSKHESPRYKPGKEWKLKVIDRVVPSHGAHRVEFQDGLSIQVHGGSGRDDLLYAMKPMDMRHENRSPGPESRREYQYAALRAVLGDRPADFIVDHDGDVRAALTDVVREPQAPLAEEAVSEIHGYNIEVFFADEHLARKFERQIEDALQLPLISQGALRDGYRLEYGPIEGSDYLKLERVIYSKVGNAGRVRLVQVMYGGLSREARRTGGTRGGPARKYYVVDQVQNGLWVQVGHFATKQAAEQFQAKLHGQTRIHHAFPSGHDHPPIAEEARRRPKAKRSVRRR